jgi:hypothetical protein
MTEVEQCFNAVRAHCCTVHYRHTHKTYGLAVAPCTIRKKEGTKWEVIWAGRPSRFTKSKLPHAQSHPRMKHPSFSRTNEFLHRDVTVWKLLLQCCIVIVSAFEGRGERERGGGGLELQA